METQVLTDREAKHLMIHNQIERYNQVLDKFSSILAEIRGEGEPMPVPSPNIEKQSNQPTPSLLDILTNGSDRLSTLNQRLEDLCNELTSLLF